MRIKKAMAGFDISDYSEEALRYAVHLVESLNAELVVVSVINRRDIDMMKRLEAECSSVSTEKFIADQKSYRESEIDRIIGETGRKGIRVKK